jgi:hypothetical protein
MVNQSPTRVDRQISWIKNHKVLSVFVVVGFILIGLGTLTDALKNLFGLFASPPFDHRTGKVTIQGEGPSIEEHTREFIQSEGFAKALEEIKQQVAQFKGLANALEENPNYSDAMHACSASRKAIILLYVLRENNVQIPDKTKSELDDAFRQTLDVLKSHEEMTRFDYLYKSTKLRYDGFLLMQEKGTSAITPRMREEWDKL